MKYETIFQYGTGVGFLGFMLVTILRWFSPAMFSLVTPIRLLSLGAICLVILLGSRSKTS